MSREPATLTLLQQSNAVNRVLGSTSCEDGLEFGLGRSDRSRKLILNEFRCMFPGGPGDVRVRDGSEP